MDNNAKIIAIFNKGLPAAQARHAANERIAAKQPTRKLEISPGHKYAWGTTYSQQEIKDALTPQPTPPTATE
jgi:hypothetical protein